MSRFTRFHEDVLLLTLLLSIQKSSPTADTKVPSPQDQTKAMKRAQVQMAQIQQKVKSPMKIKSPIKIMTSKRVLAAPSESPFVPKVVAKTPRPVAHATPAQVRLPSRHPDLDEL